MPEARILQHAASIEQAFASDEYEDVVRALEAVRTPWAQGVLGKIQQKSPQACKVALRQLALGAKLPSLEEDLRMEYRIASRVLLRPDFTEGVRAVILDKDNNPRWQPAHAEQVSDELLDEIFAPLPAKEEWQPLSYVRCSEQPARH